MSAIFKNNLRGLGNDSSLIAGSGDRPFTITLSNQSTACADTSGPCNFLNKAEFLTKFSLENYDSSRFVKARKKGKPIIAKDLLAFQKIANVPLFDAYNDGTNDWSNQLYPIKTNSSNYADLTQDKAQGLDYFNQNWLNSDSNFVLFDTVNGGYWILPHAINELYPTGYIAWTIARWYRVNPTLTDKFQSYVADVPISSGGGTPAGKPCPCNCTDKTINYPVYISKTPTADSQPFIHRYKKTVCTPTTPVKKFNIPCTDIAEIANKL